MNVNSVIADMMLAEAELYYEKTVFNTRYGWVQTEDYINDPCPALDYTCLEAYIARMENRPRTAYEDDMYNLKIQQLDRLQKTAISQGIAKIMAEGMNERDIMHLMNNDPDRFQSECIRVNTKPPKPCKQDYI